MGGILKCLLLLKSLKINVLISTVTSDVVWAPWRLKSPTAPLVIQLFFQPVTSGFPYKGPVIRKQFHVKTSSWECAKLTITLHWRHNDHDCVSNHQPHGCLLNRLFGDRSKKTSKLRVTGLCAGNSPWPVNSPHKGPETRKCFHLMTSPCCCFDCFWSNNRQKSWSLI